MGATSELPGILNQKADNKVKIKKKDAIFKNLFLKNNEPIKAKTMFRRRYIKTNIMLGKISL